MGTVGQGCGAPSKGGGVWKQEGLTLRPPRKSHIPYLLWYDTFPSTRSGTKEPRTVIVSPSPRPGAS